MRPTRDAGEVPTARRWTGIALSSIAVLFLVFDSVGKLLKMTPVVEGTAQLGYSETVIQPIGIILLLCVVVYVIPRTAILGAVLLTGYLGGAIATHVLFPIYLAVLFWGGLFLRDLRLRGVLRAPS